MPSYFAYGSNMSRSRLEQRVGAVHLHGAARLHAHRHRFSKLGQDGTGKGNVEPHEGSVVWGVVYELADDQFARLTEFEFGYRHAVLAVALAESGRSVSASSFVALNIVEALEPSTEYIEHYRIGMAEHGIPKQYRQRLLGRFAPRRPT
ncbi:gamma-glutamylcyclotransferase family protein [Enhygromyxa salina]|uniref:gamma-glutamylcyclotransferase family protein n=1 Tax=Enhygromyxa salina TaxID=215803 RepID=UPI0004E6C61E|nr:gamma-glutamylcyclotransferase family protein [Enhygromyxa salina]